MHAIHVYSCTDPMLNTLHLRNTSPSKITKNAFDTIMHHCRSQDCRSSDHNTKQKRANVPGHLFYAPKSIGNAAILFYYRVCAPHAPGQCVSHPTNFGRYFAPPTTQRHNAVKGSPYRERWFKTRRTILIPSSCQKTWLFTRDVDPPAQG